MKKVLAGLLGVIVVIFTIHAYAETGVTKFGYVDFQRALNEVDEGKRAKATLKGEFEQKQKQLDGMQNELQQMKADLEKQRVILSADALREKEETYRRKFIELTEKMNTFKMDLQTKEVRVTGGILKAVQDIVKQIGQKEGYTMILEKSQDIVLYSPADADLTARVIREFNAMPKAKRDAAARSGKEATAVIE